MSSFPEKNVNEIRSINTILITDCRAHLINIFSFPVVQMYIAPHIDAIICMNGMIIEVNEISMLSFDIKYANIPAIIIVDNVLIKILTALCFTFMSEYFFFNLLSPFLT